MEVRGASNNNEDKSSTLFVFYTFHANKNTERWKYGKFPTNWWWVGSGTTTPIGTKKNLYEFEEQFSGPSHSKIKMKDYLNTFFTTLKNKGVLKRYKIRNTFITTTKKEVKISKISSKKISTKKIPNDRESKIIVRYGTLTSDMFPDYKMVKFPKAWIYSGDEGALKSQPKWQTNNAYFYGPHKDLKKAKESIIKLYDKYKKNKYISRYAISVK